MVKANTYADQKYEVDDESKRVKERMKNNLTKQKMYQGKVKRP